MTPCVHSRSSVLDLCTLTKRLIYPSDPLSVGGQLEVAVRAEHRVERAPLGVRHLRLEATAGMLDDDSVWLERVANDLPVGSIAPHVLGVAFHRRILGRRGELFFLASGRLPLTSRGMTRNPARCSREGR